MRSTKICFTLATLLILAAPFKAVADNGAYPGSGGAFSTGAAVGQNITVQSVPLSGTQATLSFSCPITSFSSGTYALNWTCAGGSVSIASTDKSLTFHGSFGTGSMSFSGSGGGRGGHTTYWYQFSGSFSGTITVAGVNQAVNGSINQSVKTTSQIGGGSAPVTSESFGWNSAYSPVVVADMANWRLLGADNINGANLIAYGSYGSGIGNFSTIAGLAQDSTGRIYIVDSQLNRLVRIDDLTGKNWTEIGTYGTGVNQFTHPAGVAIDAAGKIYVADAGNNRIVRFDDLTGKNWTSFGTLGAGVNQLSGPSSIALDATGRIYVADAGNNRIVRFDDFTGTNWVALTTLNIGIYGYPVSSPVGVVVSPKGRIYIATGRGFLLGADDMTGANPGASYWSLALSGLSVDKAGTVYVSDGFTPALAQVEDASATGYYPSSLGIPYLRPGPVLATHSSTPPPADPALSATALAFGSRNVGEPGVAQQIKVANLGSASLAISSINAGPDYLVTHNCPAALYGGGHCTVQIKFSPTMTGDRSSTLLVESTSVHPVLSVALTGTGTAPQAVVFPGTLSFNPQQIGTTSGSQTATLSNTGSGPLTISSLVATGDFAQTNNCPKVLVAGNACTITAVFKPTLAGARSGSLTISDDAIPAGTQQTVALNGTGTSTAPAFLLSPSSLMFPGQKVNTTSSAQPVTLTNNSGAKASLTAPVYPAGFKGTSNCGTSLASGASCVLNIQFAPTAAGSVSGVLTIPITGNPSLTVGLSGTGTAANAPSSLSFNPASIDFGAAVIGDNPSLSVIITNTTGVAAGIHSIVLAGPSEFTMTANSCPSVLAGGANCSVEITFQPTSNSNYYNSGTLTVSESSGASTVIPVSGYATSGGGGN